MKPDEIKKKQEEKAEEVGKGFKKAYDDMITDIMYKARSVGIHMSRERAEAFNKMIEDTRKNLEKLKDKE